MQSERDFDVSSLDEWSNSAVADALTLAGGHHRQGSPPSLTKGFGHSRKQLGGIGHGQRAPDELGRSSIGQESDDAFPVAVKKRPQFETLGSDRYGQVFVADLLNPIEL